MSLFFTPSISHNSQKFEKKKRAAFNNKLRFFFFVLQIFVELIKWLQKGNKPSSTICRDCQKSCKRKSETFLATFCWLFLCDLLLFQFKDGEGFSKVAKKRP